MELVRYALGQVTATVAGSGASDSGSASMGSAASDEEATELAARGHVSASGSVASKTEVRFLSLNMFMRPPGVSTKGANDCKEERLDLFVSDHADNYDVICLQEIFGTWTSRRRRLRAQVQKHGLLYSTYSRMPRCFTTLPPKFSDGGLLILSRFPIVETRFHLFTAGADVDKFAAKGVLYARLDVHGRHMHVFTSHLQASYFYEADKGTSAARKQQVREMKEFVRDMTSGEGGEGPIVVAGDFNIDRFAAELDEYDVLLDTLQAVTREDPASGVKTCMVDSMAGRHESTIVPSEWHASTGTSIRSAFVRQHAEDYEDARVLASLEEGGVQSDDNGRQLVAVTTNEPRTVFCKRVEGDSFWIDTCLDYIFYEKGNGLDVVQQASVQPLPVGPKHSFVQMSDHHSVQITFRL